jgi:predicted PurR-regulated permease PerM
VIETSWWFRTTFVVVVLSAIIYLVGALGRLWGFLGDLLLIFFLAWLVGSVLLHVVNSLMRIPRMKRAWAILIVYLGLTTLVLDFALFVIPTTIVQVRDLADLVPLYVDRLPGFLRRVEEIIAGFGVEVDLETQVVDFANRSTDRATVFITDNWVNIATDVASAFFNIGLVIVISFYVVLDGGRRLNEALKVLPPKAEAETRFILHTIDETFHGYVRGMLVISLIYGVGTASVMLLTGLPAALPVAILSSVLLAVPFIGDWLALALPLTIAVMSGDFITFLTVLAVLLFVQQVMLNLLTPRILGQAVRMPAMLVIVAVVLGVRLAGIPGALLGVPTAGVLYTLSVHYGMQIRERREARDADARDALASAQDRGEAVASLTPGDGPEPEAGSGQNSEGGEAGDDGDASPEPVTIVAGAPSALDAPDADSPTSEQDVFHEEIRKALDPEPDDASARRETV